LFKREVSENLIRSRRCNGEKLLKAPLTNVGKAEATVNQSQKTCLY